MERLISVAASHTLRSLFEHMPALVFVTSEPRQIDFDLSNPPERIAEALEKLKIRTLRNVYSRYPHCECALLAYFLRLHIKDAYTTIGVSKSSCLGCRIYFRAFSVMILVRHLSLMVSSRHTDSLSTHLGGFTRLSFFLDSWCP